MKLLFPAALAAGLFAVASGAPANAAEPAQKFLTAAAQGDGSEVMLGRQIERRGGTARVRAFGAMLVRDHGKGLREVDMLARRMHLTVPHLIAGEARNEDLKLRKLRGRDYDAEVKRYMIADHEQDISDFESQAKGSDRMTAQFARNTLPTLHHHLDMAKAL